MTAARARACLSPERDCHWARLVVVRLTDR
jgi:hypothetical protein